MECTGRAGIRAVTAGTADLKRMLQRDRRPRLLAAALLIAPLFVFSIVNFVVPVAMILFQSVDDTAIGTVLVRTLPAIAAWDGTGTPDEAVYRAMYDDFRDAKAARKVTIVATRLNAVAPGYQALVNATARRITDANPSSAKTTLIDIDAHWGETDTWSAIRSMSGLPFTAMHLLRAVDATVARGRITPVPESQRIFATLWLRTFWVSLVVTVLCALLGYPLAYVMANARPRVANVLLILVLLPFWTSLLVRSMAWVALLQTQGVVNNLLLALHLTAERLPLIRNRLGVTIAMVHVLLPYMVLPLYGVMKRVPPNAMRAALSLGADPVRAFVKVYLPQTLHGVGSGAVLVFVLAVGFYVTPALVGGRNDQMISYFIAYFMNESSNWHQAAALSLLLLLFTGAAYLVITSVFRVNRVAIR
jgi:putative spermidine/putrescine transport system permease protein